MPWSARFVAIFVGLAACAPPPVEDRVGPGGGERTSGAASVTVPAGALTGPADLAIAPVEAPQPLPREFVPPPNVYALTPHGQSFAKPVTLVLPAPDGDVALLRLDGPDDTTWEEVPGAVVSGGSVTALVTHFSFYAAAKRKDCEDDHGGCDEHARCDHEGNAHTCTCLKGWTGDGRTCVDVDECQVANGGCDAHATCTNTPGGRTCACAAGFSGDGITCEAVDECATANGGCDANAICTNTAGSRTCACKAGYTGDGFSCVAANPCANEICPSGESCTASQGIATCSCSPGYTGSHGHCATGPSSCATNNGGCDPHASCATSAGGGLECTCGAGYTGYGSWCMPETVTPVVTVDEGPNGGVRWMARGGTAGEVVVAGSMQKTYAGVTSNGGADVFLAKYSASGTRLWSSHWGSAADEYANGVAVSATGGIVVAAGSYVVRFDANGVPLWNVQVAPGTATAVAFDSAGSIYVGGETAQPLDGQPLVSSGDVFVKKLDANGATLWTRIYGSSGYDQGGTIAPLPGGGVVVVGYGYQPNGVQGMFEGNPYPNMHLQAGFVVAVDGAGTKRWSSLIDYPCTGPNWCQTNTLSVAVGPTGRIAIGGAGASYTGSMASGWIFDGSGHQLGTYANLPSACTPLTKGWFYAVTADAAGNFFFLARQDEYACPCAANLLVARVAPDGSTHSQLYLPVLSPGSALSDDAGNLLLAAGVLAKIRAP